MTLLTNAMILATGGGLLAYLAVSPDPASPVAAVFVVVWFGLMLVSANWQTKAPRKYGHGVLGRRAGYPRSKILPQ